ncbi:hypothetical protein N7463_002351 [Penicillium fimorum]|uniref:Uncharacterized protein n=1 Tax=Penicillium fimorum TaxID=1882269 RepID=A0A9W9XYY1_9EURO|nr:hypothetical protein N7463_002351 [Penicillium fimorum]
MTSNCVVRTSCEANVELRSYLALDRALHEARGIYESFASNIENSGSLPANFSESLFYFEVQERVSMFFSTPLPCRVEAKHFSDTPLMWTDVLRESLTPGSFYRAPNDLYLCCVQGEWIQVTENDRSENLCGVLDGILDSLRHMPESRQRLMFENHFDKTFAFVKQLSADMEKTKQKIQTVERTQTGDVVNHGCHDLLSSNPLSLIDKLGRTPPMHLRPDIACCSNPPQTPTINNEVGCRASGTANRETGHQSASTINKHTVGQPVNKPTTHPSAINKDVGQFANNAAQTNSVINKNAVSQLVNNPVGQTYSVVSKAVGQIPSTGNTNVVGQIPIAVSKGTAYQIPGVINKVVIGQPVNNPVSQTLSAASRVTVSQAPSVVNKDAVGHTFKKTVERPSAIDKVAVSQPVHNADSQIPSATGQIGVGVGHAPSFVNKGTVNHTVSKAVKPLGAINKEAVGQTPSTMDKAAVSQPGKNVVSQTSSTVRKGTADKDVVDQPIKGTLFQTPHVALQGAVSRTTNNTDTDYKTPRTGATFQTTGAADKVNSSQQTPGSVPKDAVGQATTNLHKEVVSQVTTPAMEQTGRVRH